MTLESTYDQLTAWNEELRPIEQPVLDGLFILDRGSLAHFGRGEGSLVALNSAGEVLTGYIGQSPEDGVLTRLLLWMFAAMPRVFQFGHPAFQYLQPSEDSGSLWLNDKGEVERRH